MAVKISRRNEFFSSPCFLSHIQGLILQLKRWDHTATRETEFAALQDTASVFSLRGGSNDVSRWKSLDSRTVGIKNSEISSPAWAVLNILHKKGFDAYLVGGCVRDFLLKKRPKDFDVVTTASMKQIKKNFHHSRVVGRLFPICQVHIRNSIVEVSSFNTIHRNSIERRKTLPSHTPMNCGAKDLILWKNCMERDFTINGLFYNPFENVIYDYVDGVRDVRTCKVRTIIPAHLSFKEDCARILRGLRIAARLGLQLSKEMAAAIHNHSASITTLNKSRLLMELNFMLAYGAAEPSINLLKKFKLLEILLPVQAAYLADQMKKQSSLGSIMLMKLFSSADKVLSVERPSDCSLWLALLVFQLALMHHPQDSLVILAFSSILYHGNWSEAVQFARKNAVDVRFVPEILASSGTKSNESLLEEVSHLASLVTCSVDTLTSPDALEQSMARYPEAAGGLGLVLVSEKMGKKVTQLFDELGRDIKSYDRRRQSYDINYELLKKGDPDETRFVLGKIIMNTMSTKLAPEKDTPVAGKTRAALSKLFL